MKRGLTLVELAVALALLGVLALGLALLLGRMGEGSRRAQAEAQLQADLQEVRARLTEDVLLSAALTCTPTEANLSLPSGPVTYALSEGQVLRNGVPLTLQGGYGGGFSCDGRSLTLDLTWGGEPVATITATRRVGLALGGQPLPGSDDFPIDLSRAHLAQGVGNREVRDVRWVNQSGRPLYLQQIEVLRPSGYRVWIVELGWGSYNQFLSCYYYQNFSPPTQVPVSFQIPSCEVSTSGQKQTLVLRRLRFNNPVSNTPIHLALIFCMTNASPCPSGQRIRLEYGFSCRPNGPCRAL
ncbi:prepilin-type N-terminal cleavage/methylation domain-containing protein [Thermus oshimai]|jgi:prepilin-type N-terminal cleavage/methylation domain-containing protein|uniref:prepilin-type N-terminal cleavage/methylation domain-containing protein n=1 Tax=Thermus oshimai TaxID=56957 RepID=UPI0009D9B3E7